MFAFEMRQVRLDYWVVVAVWKEGTEGVVSGRSRSIRLIRHRRVVTLLLYRR